MQLSRQEYLDTRNSTPTSGRKSSAKKARKTSKPRKNKTENGKGYTGKGDIPVDDKTGEDGRTMTVEQQNNAEPEDGGQANNNKRMFENSRLLKREQVPKTWKKVDLDQSMKKLETRRENQRNYIKLQEDKMKRNDGILHNMKGMKQDPHAIFGQYKEDIGKLGDETGGYEMEIRFYNTMAETSDVSNKMAQEAHSDSIRFSKRLKKTLLILQDKTKKRHDNRDVMECKKAADSLQKERDKEEYLSEKMLWYQEKIRQLRTKGSTACKDEADVMPHVDDELVERRDFSGNNTGILPCINKNMAKVDYAADKYQERYPTTHKRRGHPIHPSIGNQHNTSEKGLAPVPRLDLASLLEDNKKATEPDANNNVNLPDIGETQKVTKAKHVPSPPKTPRIVKRIRSFFGCK